MSVRKPAKPKPYDPFNPYGNHPLTWYEQQARQRAQQDVNTQVNALPSAAYYTSSSQQLADALAKVQHQQAGLASSGGALYNQAYQAAAAPADRATAVAGGQVQNQNPGAANLIAALGAGSAQAMGGLQTAAVAHGNELVQNRAKQEATIRGGLQSSADKYLQQMRDDALQAAAQRTNNALAQAQLGLSASNIAFDNNLNAAKFAADQTAATGAKKSKTQARLDRYMAAARKAGNQVLNSTTKSSKVTGRKYLFNVPGDVTGDVNGVGKSVWIQAASGPDALVQISKLYPGSKPGDYRTWFTNQTQDITSPVSVKGSRSAAIEAAIGVFTDAGYTRAQAVHYARKMFGVSSPKANTNPGATSSQSR